MSEQTAESVNITLNAPVPEIQEKDIFERDIDTKNYLGKKIFIAFFRHAGCPFCNVRVHLLQKKMEELQSLNIEMIFFFESGKELLLSNQFHRGVSPIPIISDPERKYYEMFGVEQSGAKSTRSHLTTFLPNFIKAKMNNLPVHMMKGGESIKTIPAEFLVDESGMIRKMHYARSLTDRMSIDQIKDFAK